MGHQPSAHRTPVDLRRAALVSSVALWAVVFGSAGPAYPLSVSGVVLYATDDLGNPSGWDEARQEFAPSQLWRTTSGGIWHGLGVFPGLPPDSLARPPLNAADFTVDIPLVEGANDFTVIGEPGGYTAIDVFTAFALNLYLDGVVDAPAISVVFPRNAPLDGATPWPNQSTRLYGLSLEPAARGSAATYEDDAGFRMSVSRASFLPPEQSVSVDLVSQSAPAPGGSSDWLGVVTIYLEAPPTPTVPPGSYVPTKPVSPLQFGVVPDELGAGGGLADAGGGTVAPSGTAPPGPSAARAQAPGTPANETSHVASSPAPEVAEAAVQQTQPAPTDAATPNSTVSTPGATTPRATTPAPTMPTRGSVTPQSVTPGAAATAAPKGTSPSVAPVIETPAPTTRSPADAMSPARHPSRLIELMRRSWSRLAAYFRIGANSIDQSRGDG